MIRLFLKSYIRIIFGLLTATFPLGVQRMLRLDFDTRLSSNSTKKDSQIEYQLSFLKHLQVNFFKNLWCHKAEGRSENPGVPLVM